MTVDVSFSEALLSFVVSSAHFNLPVCVVKAKKLPCLSELVPTRGLLFQRFSMMAGLKRSSTAHKTDIDTYLVI